MSPLPPATACRVWACAAPAVLGRLALSALVLQSCSGVTAAEQDGPGAGGRERIAAERQAVDARFKQAQGACEGRFLLTPCLDAARSERRLALDRLRKQQLEIDDAGRRDRAAKQRQALQNRDAESAQPVRLPRAAAGPDPAPTASAAARHRAVLPPPGAPGPAPGSAPALVGPTAAAAQQVKRNRADYLNRQHEAQAHREAVLARNARQDAQRAPSTGLPVPPAAPASR